MRRPDRRPMLVLLACTTAWLTPGCKPIIQAASAAATSAVRASESHQQREREAELARKSPDTEPSSSTGVEPEVVQGQDETAPPRSDTPTPDQLAPDQPEPDQLGAGESDQRGSPDWSDPGQVRSFLAQLAVSLHQTGLAATARGDAPEQARVRSRPSLTLDALHRTARAGDGVSDAALVAWLDKIDRHDTERAQALRPITRELTDLATPADIDWYSKQLRRAASANLRARRHLDPEHAIVEARARGASNADLVELGRALGLAAEAVARERAEREQIDRAITVRLDLAAILRRHPGAWRAGRLGSIDFGSGVPRDEARRANVLAAQGRRNPLQTGP